MAARLAVVHHANQFVITNGYEDRQGIDPVVDGYTAVLRLHEEHGVVANLHLSGTLIEAIAWHCPWFLDMVKDLREAGVVALIGGVYTETPMTLFPPGFNLGQLNELLFLYEEHLGCAPSDVRISWVPERVWDTEKLAPVLTSAELANGGYRAVLLDDRLLFRSSPRYRESERARFDTLGPFDRLGADEGTARGDGTNGVALEACRIHEIADSGGLLAVPLSADFRHWVAPTRLEHWTHLEAAVAALDRDGRDDSVLVFADDLERTAGVGGWDASVLEHYDAFLRWMAEREEIEPVSLPDLLTTPPPTRSRTLDPGTFFELAHVWGAGEDYCRWFDAEAWAPYRRYLEEAEEDLAAAEAEGADKRLLELGRKHLYASTFETAWNDVDGDDHRPAGWAKAVASHARSAIPITEAARRFARVDGALDAQITDIDRDGEEEVVLSGDEVFAVVAPLHGGRLVSLFARGPEGGALVVGNPTDDWHLDEGLNRFITNPPNHPGALVDWGGEGDAYEISRLERTGASVLVELTNVQPQSALRGLRKTITASAGGPVVDVCYRVPSGVTGISVESCLSPDYYRLLREGRGCIASFDGPKRRGFRLDDVAVWVDLPRGEATRWAEPVNSPGHAMSVRVVARAPHFHLRIGFAMKTGVEVQSFGLIDGCPR
ncbi:MAG TPA: hypothetical protein VF660_04010 [Actinomycetota bacterium]